MFRIFAILLCTLYLPSTALAGAWVQDKGDWQVITTASYYSTDERFDNNGDRTSQPRYSKYEINPYIEYGLWEHTTVGANLFLDRASSSGNSNYGVAEAEFFARTRLWQNEKMVLSLQPMVKIPGFDEDNQPKISSEHPDVGASLIGGLNFIGLFDVPHFAEVEIGHRIRFGNPENQMLINATLGAQVSPEWMLLAQSFNTYRADSNTSATYTQSSGDDYTLNKLQLSAVYELNEQLALQGGGYHVLAGKNTGTGQGVILALWTRF